MTDPMRAVGRPSRGPDAPQIERPIPVPQAGEILIRVEAAGVNRPDVLQRMGQYAPPTGVSDVLGLEVAGAVVAHGRARGVLPKARR
jgi:NADPH2:quinone reductase